MKLLYNIKGNKLAGQVILKGLLNGEIRSETINENGKTEQSNDSQQSENTELYYSYNLFNKK